MKRLIQVMLIMVMAGFLHPEMSMAKARSEPARQHVHTRAGRLDASRLAESEDSGGWEIECVYCPKQFEDLSDRSLQVDLEGHTHIVYGGDHLYHAWYDGTAWQSETVDSSTGVGDFASLAIDEKGYLHVSYLGQYVFPHRTLKYAYQDADGWHTKTLDSSGNIAISSMALDLNGFPHISYYVSSTDEAYYYYLKYIYKDAKGWYSETVDTAGYIVHGQNSIAVDNLGNPYISYVSYEVSIGNHLKYAERDSNGWQVEVVDSELEGYVGLENSLAVDTNRNPHIGYYDSTYDDLKYAFRDAAGWHVEIVEDVEDVGEGPSIALDAVGNPHISYIDNTDSLLRYTYKGTQGWHFQTVDNAVNILTSTSLALQVNGTPHISYLVYPEYDLKYASFENDEWQTTTVDSAGDISGFHSIALDGTGQPHFSYSDTSNDLIYAYLEATHWYTETVDGAGISGHNSLALEGDSSPHISYYHSENGDLMYAYRGSGGWNLQTIDSKGDVGYASSIALDAGGYPHISYTESYEYCEYDCINTYSLKYTFQDDLGWHIQTIDPGPVRQPSLVLDEFGEPHLTYESLSYCSGKGGAYLCNPYVTYAHQGQTTQIYQNGERSALALSVECYPHISFIDSEQNYLVYAYQNAYGWHFKFVDQSADPYDGQTSIALDKDGFPHIGFSGADGYLLKYAHKDALGWHIRNVGSEMGNDMTLRLDQDDLPHISYFDHQNMDLKYARRTKPFSEMTVWPLNHWGHGLPGDKITYNLELTNTGQLTDTFELTSSDHLWPTTSPSEVGPLIPGETASLEIQVTIPATVTLGSSDSASIMITSQEDNTELREAEIITFSGFVSFLPLVAK